MPVHRRGTPQHKIHRYPFIHLGGERHRESQVSCPRTQHNFPGQDPNPDHSIRSRAHQPWDHRSFHCLFIDSWKIELALTGFELMNFCDAGAMLYQLTKLCTTQLGTGQLVGLIFFPWKELIIEIIVQIWRESFRRNVDWSDPRTYVNIWGNCLLLTL